MQPEQLDIELLKGFSPLDGLRHDNLAALARKVRILELLPEEFLFKEGDTEKRTIYILSGTIELLQGGQAIEVIDSHSKAAKSPIAPGSPRRATARAQTAITYISVDSDLLDVMLTWDQTGSFEISTLQDGDSRNDDDWMTMLLQAKAFHKIPPANILAISKQMHRISYKEGDTVLKQGTKGDYFYLLREGRAIVFRETPFSREGIKLAELNVGDTFGEEALISESRRNATIQMTTDGSVMRLAKEKFNTLLNEPMLDWVDLPKADSIIGQGGQWLDVRLPREFEQNHKKDAINIPLYFIRLKLNTLEPDKKYVVCCDTGRRSSAAAYILSERGFKAFVLKDGLESE